jgi:acyl-CoA thioester hydrolase
MQVFKTSRTVIANDIDHHNHVNNIRYLEWIQALAAAHWESVSTAIQRQENAWVVMRHEIDYLAAAFEGEQLELKTYVSKCEGATSIREVVIINAQTGKLLLKSKTKWCMTDPKTKRPQTQAENISSIFD